MSLPLMSVDIQARGSPPMSVDGQVRLLVLDHLPLILGTRLILGADQDYAVGQVPGEEIVALLRVGRTQRFQGSGREGFVVTSQRGRWQVCIVGEGPGCQVNRGNNLLSLPIRNSRCSYVNMRCAGGPCQ
jgi:hypothetical protein